MLYFFALFLCSAFSLFGFPTTDSNEASAIEVLYLTDNYNGIPQYQNLLAGLLTNDTTDLRRRICLDREWKALIKVTQRDFYELEKVEVSWGDSEQVETFFPVSGMHAEVSHTYGSNQTHAGVIPMSIKAYSRKIGQGIVLDTIINRRDYMLPVDLCRQRVDLGVAYIARAVTINQQNPSNLTGLDRRACTGQPTGALISAEPAPGVYISKIWVYWGDTLNQTVDVSNPTVSIIEQNSGSDANPGAGIVGLVTHVYASSAMNNQAFPVALFYEEENGERGQFPAVLTVYNDCPPIMI